MDSINGKAARLKALMSSVLIEKKKCVGQNIALISCQNSLKDGELQKGSHLIIQPDDWDAFCDRVMTFTQQNIALAWVLKPLPLSPLQCSKFGWKLIRRDIIKCVTCEAIISVKLPNPGNSMCVYKEYLGKAIKSLESGHLPFCRWPSQTSPDSFLTFTAESIFTDFMSRIDSFKCLEEAPVLDENFLSETMKENGMKIISQLDVKNSWSSFILAITGWCIRYHPKNAEKLKYFHCQRCYSSVGIWEFKDKIGGVDINEEHESARESDSHISQCERFSSDSQSTSFSRICKSGSQAKTDVDCETKSTENQNTLTNSSSADPIPNEMLQEFKSCKSNSLKVESKEHSRSSSIVDNSSKLDNNLEKSISDHKEANKKSVDGNIITVSGLSDETKTIENSSCENMKDTAINVELNKTSFEMQSMENKDDEKKHTSSDTSKNVTEFSNRRDSTDNVLKTSNSENQINGEEVQSSENPSDENQKQSSNYDTPKTVTEVSNCRDSTDNVLEISSSENQTNAEVQSNEKQSGNYDTPKTVPEVLHSGDSTDNAREISSSENQTNAGVQSNENESDEKQSSNYDAPKTVSKVSDSVDSTDNVLEISNSTNTEVQSNKNQRDEKECGNYNTPKTVPALSKSGNQTNFSDSISEGKILSMPNFQKGIKRPATSDNYMNTRKRRKIEMPARFNPIHEHRTWCPWVTSCTLKASNSNFETGWEAVIHQILKETKSQKKFFNLSNYCDQWTGLRKISSLIQQWRSDV